MDGAYRRAWGEEKYLLRTNLQQMSKSTDDGMAPSLRTPPKMDHKMRVVSGIGKPNTGITLLDMLNGKPDKKITRFPFHQNAISRITFLC
jgi:hypothetical protein